MRTVAGNLFAPVIRLSKKKDGVDDSVVTNKISWNRDATMARPTTITTAMTQGDDEQDDESDDLPGNGW